MSDNNVEKFKIGNQEFDFNRNAVIEASAGTGKTFQLEKIVEWLVTQENYDIRNILLVTFTEKAAGELKERIRETLEKLVEDEKNNDKVQKAQEALKDLPDATICTIHAFCREILTDYPFESGMMMKLGDGGNSDDALYQQAVRNVLTSKEFQDVYQKRYAKWKEYLKIEGDKHEIRDVEYLANGAINDLKKKIEKGKEKDLKAWRKDRDNWYAEMDDIISIINDLPGWNEEGGPGRYVIKHTNEGTNLSNRTQKPKAFFDALDDNLGKIQDKNSSPCDFVSALDFLANGAIGFKLCKWDDGDKDKDNKKFCEIQGFEVYAKVQTLAKDLKNRIYYGGISSNKLKSLLHHDIVVRSYDKFKLLKERSNSITFDDQIRYTEQVVKGAADTEDAAKKAFVERIRKRYKIALVDEFQDTDARQWVIFKELFASIPQEQKPPLGRLIVVGDPKQAIYVFRGADLETYSTATQNLLNGDEPKGQSFVLKYMYRSTKEMVKALNIIFTSGWFPVEEKGKPSISYTEVEYPNEPKDKVNGFKYPLEEVTSTATDVTTTSTSSEEAATATEVTMTAPSSEEAATDTPSFEKPVELLEAGDGIEEFLENAAYEMIRLYKNKDKWTDPQKQPQMDWKDMCVLVRSRNDGKVARDILRKHKIPCRFYKEAGAFCGVEAESILALFDYLSRPGGSQGTLTALLLTPLWDVEPEQLEERLNRGDAGFDRLCTKWRTYAKKRNWNRLFEDVIQKTKIRENPSGYRQIFDELLTKYGHAQSLSELTRVLRQLKSGDEAAGEHGTCRNRASETPAVQIMTIHAAKGLEANAVFVAAGFGGNATDGASKLLYYVALTRAVFKLYLPWSDQVLGKENSALRNYLGTAIQELRKDGNYVRKEIRKLGVLDDPLPNDNQGNNVGKKDAEGIRGIKGWRFKWDSFSSLGHPKKKEAEASGGSKKSDDSSDNDNQPPKSLVPKGTASGTVFHEVMERLCENDGKDDSFEIGKNDDFKELIDEKDGKKSPLLEIVRRRLAANGVPNRVGKNAEEESTAISLARMAWNALRTELDFGSDDFRLCDIGQEDRKAEVNFVIDETQLFDYCEDRAKEVTTTVTSSGNPCEGGNDDGHVVEKPREEGCACSEGARTQDVVKCEGALNGDIDLLIRRNGKYYIIDWKTNSLDDYEDETVEQAMDDAGYHWQYKIYTLAAEKWLGEKKVKGIAYLFVRGGEFEDKKPSGKYVHLMTDKEREDFKKALENRLKANDEDEERKEQEEQ